MTGRGNPPEGTPEGVPGGGDDEFRSVVFDESFVAAARLEEFSAQERLGDHAPAVRRRRTAVGSAPRQALLLVLLIAVAFGTAVYLGVRHPYQETSQPPADALRSRIIPLTVTEPVPGGRAADLFAATAAADFGIGGAGYILPRAKATGHFDEGQVMDALTVAQEYLRASTVVPSVLTGSDVRSVRLQLDPDLLGQFDSSVHRPVDDGRHAATAWMVRFDPRRVELAGQGVRVEGTISYGESDAAHLEVTADHTVVYALRRAGPAASRGVPADERASLFTVHRVVRMRFDRADLDANQLQLTETLLTAGPLACSADQADHLQPLLAGERGDGATGTDPYARGGQKSAAVCGTLAPGALPYLPRP
ncbi:hypothetical protein SRB5_58250 [Streptomyces sp. RB5]|uniref:Uncharacterized protein n=1 Tax=Streptomyces smaragdinus TaxID=2585196 RepID=A0A7K0CQ75_9ACTN|nr:hypothetical protein [Streptomyces smaragdinus]MQY15638.1 hypothetical protein [Streptomyces smaragdinus]